MIPTITAYQNNEFGFPRKDCPPETKKSDYHQKCCVAIYSLYLRNRTAWNLAGYNDFQELRDYSRGEQSTDRYKTWLLNNGSETTDNTSISSFDDTPIGKVSKREGWGNVLFQNVSPAPAIMNAVHGMMDRLDFDLFADTIDANSKALREEQKFIKLVEAKNADWQVEFKKNAGIPVDEEVVFPKSVEELEVYEAKDGFKLNVARAMQKLLRYSFNISDWDGTIRKKIVDDLVCTGYGACRDYFDTENNKWKAQYVDVANLVIQFSSETDYNDAEYAGYFRYWTVSNLRNKLPDVPEQEWAALSRACYTLYGNPRDRGWESFYSKLDPTTHTYRYDGFKVPVFECEWVDTDIQKKLYYKSVRGRDSIIDVNWEFEPKPLSEEKLDQGATQEVKSIYKRHTRQAFWVLHTDFVFDYGPVKMASREGLSKPHLTFHVEQLLQPSLMRRSKPILDQISQLFLRWQNSLAMMVERGYAINTSMLANISMGGSKMKPAEVLKMWRQTGILFYSYQNSATGAYQGGMPTPVSPMDGGLGARVEETMKAMEMQFSLLERVTGVNPVSLGGTPDPNAPVGTTNAAMQGTNNVLKPILDSIFEIKKSVGTSLIRRLQLGIRNSDKVREAYSGIISPSDMEALVMMESEGVQYGIDLKPKPDAKQKARFENWINIALQNTREQRPGIDLNDAIYFMSQLENGADLLDLEKQLEYAIEKNKQVMQKQTIDNMQAQSQANIQAQQAKDQSELGKIKAEAEAKMAEEQIRGQVKDSLLTKQFNYKFLEQLKQAADAEQGITTQNISSK